MAITCPICETEIDLEESKIVFHPTSYNNPHIVGLLDGELRISELKCGKCHTFLEFSDFLLQLFKSGTVFGQSNLICPRCKREERKLSTDSKRMPLRYAIIC